MHKRATRVSFVSCHTDSTTVLCTDSADLPLPRLAQPDALDACNNAPGNTESGSLEDETSAPSRFIESDLGAISSLVGLETLTSTQFHCGSSSLFLFEQLTALDRSAFRPTNASKIALYAVDVSRSMLFLSRLAFSKIASLPEHNLFLLIKVSWSQ